jgi:hypothetical protein
VPLKIGMLDKKTTGVVGVIWVGRRHPANSMPYNEKVTLTSLQNLLMTVLMVFKERIRYQQSEIIIREFVNKSSSS